MKKLLIALIALLPGLQTWACTNFLVGKNASADGSVMITYSQDSYGAFGWLRHYPAGKHPKGAMTKCYDYESLNYLGEIPEAAETYNVVGHVNEFQVAITETTWGGREELWMTDSTAILDYGSLMFITLQRTKTAREAIKMLAWLADTYGYRSEGESFSIADKNEAWIMDVIGKGKGRRGIVWVATRIPDDCIAVHANQARTHKIALKDKANCMYSKDVIKIAREMGYFSGKDEDFAFAKAYNPLDFGGARYCEARAWSFFNRFVDGMDRYLSYASGQDLEAEAFPLYMKPRHKVTLQQIKDAMRDHYEGTPFDTQKDAGMGIWEMPYRPTPLSFEYNGKKYFNERPISTQQPAATMVYQLRDWLPDHIGGVCWWGEDDANMVAYTPMYCSSTQIPYCYSNKDADAFTFNDKNAYWVCNWVANMVYPRYAMLFPELKAVRDELETIYAANQGELEARALAMDKDQAVKFLTDYGCNTATQMVERWNTLARRLIVKYNDMAVKEEKDGQYLKTPGGEPSKVSRPGYPESYRKLLIETTGDKYLIPEKK